MLNEIILKRYITFFPTINFNEILTLNTSLQRL